MTNGLGNTVNWNDSNGAATPLSSPTKLAPHHNIFMTNLQKSPTNPNRSYLNDTPGSSSSKVIESLHEQTEILTKTNLQLTIQSHGLIQKLENTQEKESNLIDNLSKLKMENDTLNNLLSRETDHLRDLEIDLSKINENSNNVHQENIKLKNKLNQISISDSLLQEECIMVEAQYNSLLVSQISFKNHYDDQINKLRKELDSLKSQNTAVIESFEKDTLQISDKLIDFSMASKEFQQFFKENNNLIEKHFQKLSDDIGYTGSTANDFQLYKQELIDIGNEIGLANIEKDIDELVKFKSPNNIQPQKLPKLRNSTNTSNNSNRRTSFYGSMSPITDSNDNMHTKSPIMGLPGVKRVGSLRKTSGNSSSDTPKSSSPVPLRNLSSSSPSSSSSSRMNRNSMIMH